MTQETARSRPTIVGLGEVLWDVFSDGAKFGGAPANFASSAAGLAGDHAQVHMVSSLGSEDLGERARLEFEQHNVDSSCVQHSEKQTGQVLVTVDGEGHASYEFAADTAWDNICWNDELSQLAANTDAVCFGTLGQRSAISKATIRQFLENVPRESLRVFDINLRPPFWDDALILDSLPLGNVLKCNEDELPVIATLLGLAGSDTELLQQLIARFSYRIVALTRGSAGSLLMTESGEISDSPGVETTVVDTVGAGDSFTAAIVLGTLAGQPLKATHDWANRVSAFVCSQAGATPSIPSELQLPEGTASCFE